jgi:isopropylmalate/homocitrate/citramalate synthase
MKFSAISLLALPALFLPALAAPAPGAVVEADTAALERRQISSAYSIVSDLYTEIQQYTGSINSTADSLSATSTQHEKNVAAKSYRQNIKSITAAVKSAKKQTDKLSPATLAKRQTDTALAELVENLLLEISGALNNIIATLGLSK